MPVLTLLTVLWWLGACAPAADLTLARKQACLVPGGAGPLPLVSPAECARRGGRPLYFASAAPEVSVIHGAEEERSYFGTSFTDVPGEGDSAGDEIGEDERPDPNAAALDKEEEDASVAR